MPLYRVTWNGQDILDYTDERMVLLSPHLEMEVNTAGSLRFVVPPYHTYYNLFTEETMLISDVEVYEDDELIWFGRPLELHIDFFKQKEIYCEGGLAFFNDSIQEQSKYDNVNIVSFFKSVIDNHNYQVDSNRQFIVGNVTIDDKIVYREPKYEKTLNVLRSQCLDTNDGYFFVRKENGLCYIDWLKDMPFSCNQTIEFAENLLNVSTSFDGHDYATCVMPLGADDGTGYPIDVSDVNGGDILVISEMAKVYGKIVTVLQFNDIEEKTELLEEGRKALERIQYNSRLIECSAADLHSRDGSKEIFKVGQMVHCYSQPHELEMDLPLSKMDLNLDTAAKNITLGIIKKKTLTRITKAKGAEAYSADSYTPESYNPDSSVIEDLNGDEWEIVMPEESGDPITAIRMPIKITVARDPNKTTYKPGEALDFTGLVVNIWTKNKDDEEIIWTNPPRYLDGTAPMSELSFSTRTAPNVEDFSVQVIWKYKGKSFSALLRLSVQKKESNEWTDGDGVNCIAITFPITNPSVQCPFISEYMINGDYVGATRQTTVLVTQYYISDYNYYALFAADLSDSNQQMRIFPCLRFEDGSGYSIWTSGGTVGLHGKFDYSQAWRAVTDTPIGNVPISTKDPRNAGDLYPVE